MITHMCFLMGQASSKVRLLEAEYWNTLIQTEVYLLAKHGVGVWRGWKMVWVGFGVFMSVEKSLSLKICLSVY